MSAARRPTRAEMRRRAAVVWRGGCGCCEEPLTAGGGTAPHGVEMNGRKSAAPAAASSLCAVRHEAAAAASTQTQTALPTSLLSPSRSLAGHFVAYSLSASHFSQVFGDSTVICLLPISCVQWTN